MTTRLLFLLLILMLHLWAQRSDTIYRKIVTDAAGTVSAAVPNIGQTQHQVLFTYTDNAFGPCTMPETAQVWIEGSHDGTIYDRMSPAATTLQSLSGGGYVGVITAHGAFPFVRLAFYQQYLGCHLNAWYTGAVPTATYPQLLPAHRLGLLTEGIEQGTAGSYTFISNPSPLQRIVIYGIEVAHMGSGPVAVSIVEREGPGCSGLTYSPFVVSRSAMPAGSQVIVPVGGMPWYVAKQPGNDLCFVLGGNEPVYARILYRYE